MDQLFGLQHRSRTDFYPRKKFSKSVALQWLHLRKIQINLVFRSICTIFSLCEKMLPFENTKKNKFSFGILLTYSYLCILKDAKLLTFSHLKV